jgi:hypothetical protein
MNKSLFLLHPAHAEFLNGSKRKLVGSSMGSLILLSIVGLICAGLGLGLTVYAINEQTLQDALAQNGIVKLAVVTDGHITRGRSTSYYLTYSYDVEVDGEFETFSREESVSSTLYNKSDIGGRISIRYLPDDPGNARAIDEPFRGIVYVGLGIVFVGLGLYVMFSHIRQYRRDRRLESDGQIVSGNIINSSTKGWGNKRQLHIQYEFHSPYGVQLTGKQSAARRDVEPTDVPPGTKVAIVYYDDHIFRML